MLWKASAEGFCGRFWEGSAEGKKDFWARAFAEGFAEGLAEGFAKGFCGRFCRTSEGSAPPAQPRKVSGRFPEGFWKVLGLQPWHGLPERIPEGFTEGFSGRFSRRLSGRFCGRFCGRFFAEGSKILF